MLTLDSDILEFTSQDEDKVCCHRMSRIPKVFCPMTQTTTLAHLWWKGSYEGGKRLYGKVMETLTPKRVFL